MKIFNAEQIRNIDALTIEREPVASWALMERAAGKCAAWLRKNTKAPRYLVFCGQGNNGGDGLVIARMLAGKGASIYVYAIRHSRQASEDHQRNEKRLKGLKNIHFAEIFNAHELPDIRDGDLIIDALVGTGLNRTLKGLLAQTVRHINLSGNKVISIDLPGGLFAEDNSANDPECIIRADHTLSFQSPKLAFLMADQAEFTGEWHLLDIGLNAAAMDETLTDYEMISPGMLRSFYRPRPRFSHKGHFGHALLMAGSRGMAGAAVLAAKACLRSGVGLLSVALPACVMNIVQTCAPEAMCLPGKEDDIITEFPGSKTYKAVAAGPGMGLHEHTSRAVRHLIQQQKSGLLLDADALNILAGQPAWPGFLPAETIITPHPGEFSRLAGKSHSCYEQLQKAREFARRFHLVLVLKGAYTAVISPDGHCYFNPTGHPGMATGGSGDVLTGIILAWLSKGYSPLQAALTGVYLHGYAAELALGKRSLEAFRAGDIIEFIPAATRRIFDV